MFFVFQKRLQAKSLGILNTLMLESQIGLTALIPEGGSWAKKNPRHAKKRGFVFCFPKTPSSEKLGRFFENKKPATFVAGFPLRRMRDSNPRRCNPQQFSRLPHSTTLPILQLWIPFQDSASDSYRNGHSANSPVCLIRYSLIAGANITSFF